MQEFNPELLKNLYRPTSSSHKGQNGKLLIIGGSQLFHAASLWALTVASRIVDMVFYSSVETNNRIVESIKSEFRNGIVIPRSKLENYIQESDCILIGPGLPRKEGQEKGDDDTKELTERMFASFPNKKWVVDGGSLQVIEPDVLPKSTIVTPHQGEVRKLFGVEPIDENVEQMAKKFGIVILLKGEYDVVASPTESVRISGGNPGMTKGGTGDVLAGLIAALYCKNDAFLSAAAGSYVNKKVGDSLFKKVGYYFNASDLAAEIPIVMKELL
ncbi:MAG: NAD(P)H-hydrate dehydratase [Candidatus Levybacteria bacterium]|nr:NAD(P)H-hydrate dehydratase [Candidatus Levybacteria bacterium]